ncbi:MAG: protein kinase [Anaerolineales bacterium]|jgi:Tol biopolymer transport system component
MSATLERGALLHKRYRIVDILGQGGMGSVYRAIDENLGMDVAVKENLFTTDEYARQFRLEAVLLANLRHPNLPRVTDHFVVGDQGQYLVMDFIEGEDLRQRMERVGTITEQEAILIGAAMCDALQYLHTRKPAIIHRDVKPGNVRIAPDGHVYLVDFGLAKLIKGGQATTTGARAMTPGYSPPEQYGTARTDPRTDIYSLGATLYAALCGIIPEDGLARAMDNVELTPLRERNPHVSRKLAAGIEKAMAVHPDDRFQTAEEFRQALLTSNVKTQRLEGEIVVEPPPQGAEQEGQISELSLGELVPDIPAVLSPPPARPPRKGWSTGCWISISFFLLALLIAVLGLVFFWPPASKTLLVLSGTLTARRGTPIVRTTSSPGPVFPTAAPSLAPTEMLTPTRTRVPSWTPTAFSSLTPSPIPTGTETASPSATALGGGFGQIAFASSRSGDPQIFLMNADGTNPVQVTNLPDGACQPDWSPDGGRIVFTSPCTDRQDQYPGSHLDVINVDGTGLTTLPTAGGGDFDPAWSPDGKQIAFTSLRDNTPQIYLINLADDAVSRLTQASLDNIWPLWSLQPAWSPDGSQIVFTAKRLGVLQIWVMNSLGGDQAQIVRNGSDYWDFLPSWAPDGKSLLFSETKGPQALGWLMTFALGDQQNIGGRGQSGGSYATRARYSPDGSWIAFEGTEDGINYDVYRLGSDGKGRTRLTTDPALDFDPVWRPLGIP